MVNNRNSIFHKLIIIPLYFFVYDDKKHKEDRRMYFKLTESSLNAELEPSDEGKPVKNFIEVDFPGVTARKCYLIKRNKQLLEKVVKLFTCII